MYTSESESYDTNSESDNENDVIESSTNYYNNNNVFIACQDYICNCENSEFYKL